MRIIKFIFQKIEKWLNQVGDQGAWKRSQGKYRRSLRVNCAIYIEMGGREIEIFTAIRNSKVFDYLLYCLNGEFHMRFTLN